MEDKGEDPCGGQILMKINLLNSSQTKLFSDATCDASVFQLRLNLDTLFLIKGYRCSAPHSVATLRPTGNQAIVAEINMGSGLPRGLCAVESQGSGGGVFSCVIVAAHDKIVVNSRVLTFG